MLTVVFDVPGGETQYARSFEAYEHELDDLSEPLGQVADHLRDTVGEQFLTEGAHGLGARWLPLNPDYERWKDEHYPGRPMLVRTGAMREAFLVHGTRDLTESRLVWGVDTQLDDDEERIAVRAGAHQSGRGVVPQRKIIALTALDRRDIDRIFASWLVYLRRRIFTARGAGS